MSIEYPLAKRLLTFQVVKQVLIFVCGCDLLDVLAGVMASQLWREQ